ncbi:lipoate--protein ligase [Malacoplasma muris]|uniref:lipoate--protein ligase n=1 Tax=Malacoplasma muris TaxID=2119 RepID=UPI00398F06ED
MKIIKLLNDENPYINLASEEFLLKYEKDLLDEDLFIIWKNKNTIVIGNTQNAFSEINLMYVNNHNIKVVRRLSGGGAVYHDKNNFNFTFIKRKKRNNFSFQECLDVIIEFLGTLNINAKYSGRNDITVDGKKISGNAVTFYQNDYLLHGTLLFDIDIEKLVESLHVDKNKLVSKGIESVKSRVMNIKELLPYSIDVIYFEKLFIDFLEKKYNTKTMFNSYKNNSIVNQLVLEKYMNYEYIFGRNYNFNFKNSVKLPNALISVELLIDDGTIKEIHFYTDALYENNIKELEKYFVNTKYNMNIIEKSLNFIDLNKYMYELDKKQFIELLFKNN